MADVAVFFGATDLSFDTLMSKLTKVCPQMNDYWGLIWDRRTSHKHKNGMVRATITVKSIAGTAISQGINYVDTNINIPPQRKIYPQKIIVPNG
ncbi:hypothetical protein BELL_0788g00030 [Botrytis elliptica]|uniref:Uncharacterized protein n=1 Tax=Botrytis elliptica TaxID=278938 RepID=A0A4Z1JCF3_9HELO|nr:hypothetical protein BELL_0788g00030 [Botrytis elliptica]